jgi:hypothetical protein
MLVKFNLIVTRTVTAPAFCHVRMFLRNGAHTIMIFTSNTSSAAIDDILMLFFDFNVLKHESAARG